MGTAGASKGLIGQQFGLWTVIATASIAKDRSYQWVCKCACGTTRTVNGRNLRSGGSLGCGCNRGRHRRKRPYEALYNILVKQAAKRAHDISLSFEDFVVFTTVNECHYCAAAIHWSRFSCSIHGCACNLDRKDSSCGYSKENLVVCCARCNKAKCDLFTYDEFVKIGNLIRTWNIKVC